MSDLPILGAPERPSAWKMMRAMVGVGLICGLFIVGVYQATLPTIERNKAEALQAAIFQVLPDARSSTTFLLGDDGSFEELTADASAGRLVYAGYDEQGALVGMAIETSGMGYQDVITVIYGYSFVDEAIVGIRVLASKETPGLGDRIETDEAFLKNFEKLDVSLSADRSALAHPIEAVKQGKKEQPWQVDGITGATISSVAIADMLRDSATFWAPLIQARLDDFKDGEEP